jgi:hypothetical protein
VLAAIPKNIITIAAAMTNNVVVWSVVRRATNNPTSDRITVPILNLNALLSPPHVRELEGDMFH